jgi:hypothetical protein
VENFDRTQCASLGIICPTVKGNISDEIQQLSLYRRSALASYNFSDTCSGVPSKRYVQVHYNNGVTAYDEVQTTVYC